MDDVLKELDYKNTRRCLTKEDFMEAMGTASELKRMYLYQGYRRMKILEALNEKPKRRTGKGDRRKP